MKYQTLQRPDHSAETAATINRLKDRIKMLENLQLEHLSEIHQENARLHEQNKRQNELIDSLREMYAKESK